MPPRPQAPLIRIRIVIHHDPQQAELPAPTELNYDVQPFRVLRQFRLGLSHMAGLSQWGSDQTFDEAYLPPPVRVGPIQKVRNIGGAWNFGAPASPTVHVPGVLVPRTVG